MNTKKKKTFNGVCKLFKQVWKANPKYVILSFIGVFINIPERVFNVYTLSHVVLFAIEGSIKKISILIITYFLFMLVITIGRCCFQAYKKYAEEDIREKIKANIYFKIQNIDISAYDNPDFYDVKAKVIEMSDSTILQCYNNMIKLMRSIISAFTYVGILLTLTPLIIFIVCISCCIAILINFSKAKYAKKQFDELSTINRKIAYVDYCFNEKSFIYDTKTENFSTFLLKDFIQSYYNRKQIIKKYARKELKGNIGSESVILLADCLSWAYLGYSIIVNKILVGEFVSVINSVWGLTQQLFNVFNIFPQLYADGLFSTILDEFFSYSSQIQDFGERDIDCGINRIELRNVSFSYKDDSVVLTNINLIARKGERIAIVGKNGAGKSTLMKIMLRLYEPNSGDILINEIGYENYPLSTLQKEIAVVFQKCNVYSYSVAENILMRKCENKEDEQIVEKALSMVGLLAKIKMYPHGIYSNIYNRFDMDGIQFSGGELQRIAIARALAKNSSLIILDEPTASLDGISEIKLLQCLNKEYNDKILILISHKLSLIKDFSQIIVVDKGCIVEHGTHEELLHNQGEYYKLWRAQVEAYGVSKNNTNIL